ncbi:MAG TPA: hypothetical protein VF133_06285 [Terriglobales bacterium]
MSRMLDLIRASAVSSHQMMSASRGALHLPPVETLQILVHIAEHNKIYGEQARLTLAAWDETTAKAIAAEPDTPREILEYWLHGKNIRPVLFPILLENPTVPVGTLSQLATTLKGELLDVMIASPRVRASQQLLQDLSKNHYLSGAQAARVQALISGKPDQAATEEQEATPAAGEEQAPAVAPEPHDQPLAAAHEYAPAGGKEKPAAAAHQDGPADAEAETAVVTFFKEHAAEIAAEPEKPFQAIGGIHEEAPAPEPARAAAAAASSTPAQAPQPAPAHKAFPHKLVNPEEEKRGSVLQKIAKLDVKGRIQLAMKGTKEERSILVRDGTKIVALAVLDSPKITDGEVEKFASQKNVLEAVLRAIPMKRRFAKNYAIVRNLIFNPRTPLDVSLGLMKNLLVADLRNLSGNKEVAETVRKLALRMFKQKSDPAKKG